MKKGKFILLLLGGILLFFVYRFFSDMPESIESPVSEATTIQATLDATLPTSFQLIHTPSESSSLSDESDKIPEVTFAGERLSEAKIGAFYFNHLSPEEQSLYRYFYDHVIAYHHTIEIGSYQFDKTTVHKVIKAMLYDSPELFWLSESYHFYTKGSDVVVRIEFAAEEKETIERALLEINAIAEVWIQYANTFATDYEKVKFVYEEIIQNTDYVLESENNQDIRSVFLHKESVCAGYAKAFQYMLDRMGIYNLFVSGKIITGNLHAWNMVRLDDTYYWVDVTWGDPVFPSESKNDGSTSYNYLFITDDEIFRTHVPVFDYSGEIAPFFTLPECHSTDYDYYRLFENYMDAFDYDSILNDIVEGYWAGDAYFMVKCASKELWEQIRAEISEGTLLSDVYKQINDGYQSPGMLTSFFYDDKMYTIKMILFSEPSES